MGVLYINDKVNRQATDQIARHFCWILFPVYVILGFKVWAGIRMIKNHFKKPVFMTYYVCSWSFYGSFMTQVTLILIAQWEIMHTWAQAVVTTWLCAMIPCWMLMNIQQKVISD